MSQKKIFIVLTSRALLQGQRFAYEQISGRVLGENVISGRKSNGKGEAMDVELTI